MTQEKNLSQLWMIPFADLMSTMVILFLALFGYAYLEKTPEYERAIAQLQKEMGLSEEEKKRSEVKEKEAEIARKLKEEVKAEEAELEITTQKIRLTFASPILFAEGSARLKSQAARTLRRVASALQELSRPVEVEGHTDNQRVMGGRYPSNWELSAARAFSVIEFFVREGLPASRFSALGYAEHRPIASNAEEAGRRRNRRIEISILRQE